MGQEIEIPFQLYETYCSRCIYKFEILTPLDEKLKQRILLGKKRGNIKLRCSKYPPCSTTGKWEAVLLIRNRETVT